MKNLVKMIGISMLLISSSVLAHEDKPKTALPASAAAPGNAGVQVQTATAPQHSGGTDSKGCHTNHSTGVYHCHNPK